MFYFQHEFSIILFFLFFKIFYSINIYYKNFIIKIKNFIIKILNFNLFKISKII